jgi:tRNA (guanine37-N1)-methyltransferase
MRIDILTLFCEMFESPLNYSILKRAQAAGVVKIVLSNIRDYATDHYKKVDDKPYGGGPGMVMLCGPVFDCVKDVRGKDAEEPRVIMLSPAGRRFDQAYARELACEKRLMLIAGRYEGFDERIREGLGAEQLSIGDYVLSGGELGAMVVVDAVVRLLAGALGDETSRDEESFGNGLLEYPHYTRPEEYGGMRVPEILLSGDHAKIAAWRLEQSKRRTKEWRPDIWEAIKENFE